MRANIGLNESGLSLVELLVTLAITSLISVLIFTNLFSGMKSYKNVNKQISLHDEANYVMTQFVNQIYVATKVEVLYPPQSGDTEENAVNPCKFIIKTTKMNDEVTTLGFDKPDEDVAANAVINDQNILQSPFSIVCKDPIYPSIKVDDSSVIIEMTVQDNESGKQFELKNKVSYVKVE
jgi:type II secretory pathway pseudopilin PulG